MQKIKNSSILYIEDDEITRENIAQYLQRVCKTLYIANDGIEGLKLFEKHTPNIVISDIEMPKLNGLDLAKKIRKISKSTNIIITTAFTSQEYLLEAVNLKLTKYITKPISLPKLNQALKECEDFLEEIDTTKKYFNEHCFYDTFTKELIKTKEIISLSKTERLLLELLIKNYPTATSYEAIETNVYEFATSKNAIKLLIKSLRAKIGKETVTNISGYGYNIKLKEPDE